MLDVSANHVYTEMYKSHQNVHIMFRLHLSVMSGGKRDGGTHNQHFNKQHNNIYLFWVTEANRPTVMLAKLPHSHKSSLLLHLESNLIAHNAQTV